MLIKKIRAQSSHSEAVLKENGTETQVCRPPYFILLSQVTFSPSTEWSIYTPQTYQEASLLVHPSFKLTVEKTAVAQHSLGGFLASLSPQSSVPLWCHTPSGNFKEYTLRSHRKGFSSIWCFDCYMHTVNHPYDPWYPCQPIEFILQSLHRGFITWKVDELRPFHKRFGDVGNTSTHRCLTDSNSVPSESGRNLRYRSPGL